MTGHVQSASGKFASWPRINVWTAIFCPGFGVQVEAAQSAKYPLQIVRSRGFRPGAASAAPPGRAVSGANTRSTVVRPNTTFDHVLPLIQEAWIGSVQSKRVAELRFL